MTFDLYEAYLVGRERRADAMRDAENRRLIKSLKKEDSSPRWLQRLGLRRLEPVHPDEEVGRPRHRARQTASSPTL